MQVKEAALELGYQPTPTFCLKVSQLREIFEVRWSVFLLGPAGCGKSAVWKTLLKAQNDFGEKTIYRPINPKVIPACCDIWQHCISNKQTQEPSQNALLAITRYRSAALRACQSAL